MAFWGSGLNNDGGSDAGEQGPQDGIPPSVTKATVSMANSKHSAARQRQFHWLKRDR